MKTSNSQLRSSDEQPRNPAEDARLLTDGGQAVSERTDRDADHPAVIWHGLSAFQRDSLRVIAGLGNPKGVAIKDRLATYYEQEVNHGRLYPNLNQLVEAGLLEKGEKDGRTNAYRLTDRGHTVLDARDDILQGGVER